LLRFRPGEVLQELVARRRRKGSMFGEKFTLNFYDCFPKRENKKVLTTPGAGLHFLKTQIRVLPILQLKQFSPKPFVSNSHKKRSFATHN